MHRIYTMVEGVKMYYCGLHKGKQVWSADVSIADAYASAKLAAGQQRELGRENELVIAIERIPGMYYSGDVRSN